MSDKLDLIDRKIVAELMRDASVSIGQIAERVGLSQTPCWRRIQSLEANGVITGRVALVDPARIGVGLTVLVEVEAGDHSAEWQENFLTEVGTIPNVMDAYRLAGRSDYLLKVVTKDVEEYDRIYKRLVSRIAIRNVTSHIVIETMKSTTVYPVDTHNR